MLGYPSAFSRGSILRAPLVPALSRSTANSPMTSGSISTGWPAPGGWTFCRDAPSSRVRSRSPRPMPVISSPTSFPSLATAAPSCSARSSTRADSAATFSSKALDELPSRVGETAALHWVRCCASTWSAKPWQRSAFPRRARSPPSRPARSSSARCRYRGRPSSASPRAMSGSGPFNSLPRVRTSTGSACSPITSSPVTTRRRDRRRTRTAPCSSRSSLPKPISSLAGCSWALFTA